MSEAPPFKDTALVGAIPLGNGWFVKPEELKDGRILAVVFRNHTPQIVRIFPTMDDFWRATRPGGQLYVDITYYIMTDGYSELPVTSEGNDA